MFYVFTMPHADRPTPVEVFRTGDAYLHLAKMAADQHKARTGENCVVEERRDVYTTQTLDEAIADNVRAGRIEAETTRRRVAFRDKVEAQRLKPRNRPGFLRALPSIR